MAITDRRARTWRRIQRAFFPDQPYTLVPAHGPECDVIRDGELDGHERIITEEERHALTLGLLDYAISEGLR